MSGDELDPETWETYPGERAKYEELDNAPEHDPSTDEIDWSVFEGADGSVIAPPPPEGVALVGPEQGAISVGSPMTVTYTDLTPGVDHLGQPVRHITGTITTSGGHSQPVDIHLAGFENGIATYTSRPLSSTAGPDADLLPLEVGETVSVQVGSYSTGVDHVFATPHEARLHGLRTELQQAGIFMADLLRAYRAATEGAHDVPLIATNIEILQQGVRTAQLGLEHFDDPGSHVVQIARAEYYLSHIGLNRRNLEALLEGRPLFSPYDDDIRDTRTLKNEDSILSFYMNDVVIHQHFDTLVEDAEGWAEHRKDAAIGESFDESVKGLLRGSYEAIVSETGVGSWYPLLDLAVSGEGRDHMGRALTAGDWTNFAIGVALSAADKTKGMIDGPSPAGTYSKQAKDWATGKFNSGVKDATIGGLAAGVEHVWNQAAHDARPPDADPNAGPPPAPSEPVPQPTLSQQPFWKSTKAKAGAAVGVVGLVIGGAVVTTSGDDAPTTDPPPIVLDADADADPTPSVDQSLDDPGDAPLGEPPALDGDPDAVAPVAGGEVPLPPRDPNSFDTETVDLTLAEGLALPHPEMSTADDADRPGGGSLWVTTTWVLDWQDDQVLDNGIISSGGFVPGATYEQELIILADCSSNPCVYTHQARVPANGVPGLDITFTVDGGVLYGSVPDSSGGCDRTVFMALRVSDFQTINGRLVPDAIDGGRIEYGTCVESVYREIRYEGGFRFVGSFADQ